MKEKKTYDLVLISLLIAVELVLMFTPLGYIPLGVIRATTLHIPVILAGIVLGYRGGMTIGLVFGLTSVFINTMTPTATSFVFSPFYSIGEVSGNFMSLVIAIVPRVMLGAIAAFIYQLMMKTQKQTVSVVLASLLSTLAHTALVLGGIYVFFGSSYAAARNIPYNTLFAVLMGVVTTNGIMEAILAAVIVLALSKVLLRTRKA